MKRGKLTQREIKARAAAKRSLQEQGVIPPDKPRLNRKRFAKEVLDEFDEAMTDYGDNIYLYRAIGCMVSKDMREVTSEEVGVLKLLKLAVETKRFMETLRAEGRSEYTVGEYYDKVVKPVVRL